MKKKISLKAQMVFILLGYVFLVLSVIYIAQTVFLDDFYKKEKISSMERISHTISANLDEQDLEDVLDNLTLSNEVCVRIFSRDINLTGYAQQAACALKKLDVDTVNYLADQTQKAGGERLFDNFSYHEQKDLYIYAQMASRKGETAMVLVSSLVTPLDVTLETLRKQYFLISTVVTVTTILVGLLISRLLLTGIGDIEKEASLLPTGNYNGEHIHPHSKELYDLNRTLSISNDEILKAEKAKRELLGNVSHDLRTPLTMIRGYGEMIKEFPEEDTKENVDIILKETDRLSDLVNDLLELSSFEDGKIPLQITSFPVSSLFEDIKEEYSAYLKEQGVSFEAGIKKDHIINADRKRLHQVLSNFMNNALNHMDKQDKKISLSCEKKGDFVRIELYDNGEGIEEKDLPYIWERYYKVDREHKRYSLGSGIGLSLCKSILEEHDFPYGVQSVKHEYSRFYFDVKYNEEKED